jgi:pullulanase/glycogen debranching enzyme
VNPANAFEIWPGRPLPLGAHYDGAGTNFSVFSEVAESVVLCLFEDDGTEWQRPLLGPRSVSLDPAARIDHLRSPREGIHGPASRHP